MLFSLTNILPKVKIKKNLNKEDILVLLVIMKNSNYSYNERYEMIDLFIKTTVLYGHLATKHFMWKFPHT